jgi:shikimate dehydrogenase
VAEYKRLAVIGFPVAHSRSPAMQNAALADLGLGGEWSYEAIELAPAEFAERTRALASEGFVGANVTVPHKEAALALADSCSDMAIEIGAANTLSFAAGEIRAENTDAPGLLEALPEDPAGKRALVLGAGGAARAVVWALRSADVEVDVWNRTPERAEALVAEFGVSTVATPSDGLRATSYDLLVNATAAGMGAKTPAQGRSQLKELGVGADEISDRLVVVDLAYGSEETELCKIARAQGARVIDGIEVLVRQGAASLRIWTGLKPPLEVMRAAARFPTG